MLSINLDIGVRHAINLCKGISDISVELEMSSGTIHVPTEVAITILKEIEYTANLCYEQGYLNEHNTNGRYCA